MKYYNQLTLEELLAKTLLELEFLHEEVDRNNAGLSRPVALISKALSRICLTVEIPASGRKVPK